MDALVPDVAVCVCALPCHGQQAGSERQSQWCCQTQFSTGQSQQHAIDQQLRNFRRLRRGVPKSFLQPDQQFDRTGPVEEVLQCQQIDSGNAGQSSEGLAVIADVVVVDIIVRGPQGIESRDCDQDASLGTQQAASVFESSCGIRQMLQHVQHQDQIKSPCRLKIGIKRLAVDSLAVRTVRGQRCLVGFNTEYPAKSGEAGEQQPVTTADVKDVCCAVLREAQSPNLSQNGSLPRPPPPVLPIQIPILLSVLALHLNACP